MAVNNPNMKIITGNLLFEGSISNVVSKLLISISKLHFSAIYDTLTTLGWKGNTLDIKGFWLSQTPLAQLNPLYAAKASKVLTIFLFFVQMFGLGIDLSYERDTFTQAELAGNISLWTAGHRRRSLWWSWLAGLAPGTFRHAIVWVWGASHAEDVSRCTNIAVQYVDIGGGSIILLHIAETAV